MQFTRPSPYQLVLKSKPASPHRTIMRSQPTTPKNCSVFTFPDSGAEVVKYATMSNQHGAVMLPKRRRHASCNQPTSSNYIALSQIPMTKYQGRQRHVSVSATPSYDFTRKIVKESQLVTRSKIPPPTYEQHSNKT